MTIPDEAVDAALDALNDAPWVHYPPNAGDEPGEEAIRAALAAALPHLETAGIRLRDARIRELEAERSTLRVTYDPAYAQKDARIAELEDGIRQHKRETMGRPWGLTVDSALWSLLPADDDRDQEATQG